MTLQLHDEETPLHVQTCILIGIPELFPSSNCFLLVNSLERGRLPHRVVHCLPALTKVDEFAAVHALVEREDMLAEDKGHDNPNHSISEENAV